MMNPEKLEKDPVLGKTPPNRQLKFWICLLTILLIVQLFFYLKSTFFTKARHTPAVPVVVDVVKSGDVPVYLSALGAVTPLYSVTVKTQINGTLLKVFFREGQLVNAGDLLAQIDPRPYEAQLQEYEGQLARDQALLANAKIDLARYRTLWKQDAISQQTVATQQALVKQYEGAVQTDLGLIQVTKVNLNYCRIISPINGRIGLRLVDPGNYVQTSDNGIAVVNTLDPITVIFTIPEDRIPEILPNIYAGVPFAVEAYDRQQNKLLATGKLLTIDNQIDPTTGTVKLRAEFDNSHHVLFASQFVNVRLRIKILKQALIVPTTAIQYRSKESYVYVINDDNTAHSIPVTVSVSTGENTVIESSLTPGRRVVVEGADKLSEGTKITVQPTTLSVRSDHAEGQKTA